MLLRLLYNDPVSKESYSALSLPRWDASRCKVDETSDTARRVFHREHKEASCVPHKPPDKSQCAPSQESPHERLQPAKPRELVVHDGADAPTRSSIVWPALCMIFIGAGHIAHAQSDAATASSQRTRYEDAAALAALNLMLQQSVVASLQ